MFVHQISRQISIARVARLQLGTIDKRGVEVVADVLVERMHENIQTVVGFDLVSGVAEGVVVGRDRALRSL